MAQSGTEPAKRKERDFILLSEFAEIRHGPQPICTIPDGGEGSFDTSSFSVRIFSTDFQQGQSEEFSVSPDSQVLLTETSDGLFAYVHYFALNDIEARGYMRQYCLSYLTASPSKLIDSFQRIKKDFSEVTSLFKCGNHKVFRHDLNARLKDIEFSLDELNEDKQRVEDNSLYNGCYEDIPEMNKSVLLKDREFTKKILDTINFEMQSETNKKFHELIRNCDSNDVVRKRGNSNFYTTASFTQSVHKPKRIMAHLSQRFTRQQRTLNELSSLGYQLAINTLKSLFEKYCRSEFALRMEQMESELLNPLSSLLTVGRVPMINVLRSAVSPPLNYKIISSSDEESLFQIRQQLKFNSSSLLNNENCSSVLLYLDPLPRQRMVSVVDPLGTPHNHSLMQVDPRYSRHSYDPRQPIKEDPYEKEDLEYHENSDTNTRTHNGIYHQYDNDRDNPREWEGSASHDAHQSNERVSSSYNTPDPIPSPTPDMVGEVHPYATPPQINHSDVIKRLSDSHKDQELVASGSTKSTEYKEPSNSLVIGSNDSSRSELIHSQPQMNSQSVPPNKLDLHSFDESSNTYYTPAVPYPPMFSGLPSHRRASGIFNHHEGYPFISSVHLIESSSPHKPGKELVSLFKDVPELRDILYCLLIGRPFAIIASQRDEKLVRRHIRALWLFVAGYSSHHQVIPWQEEQFDTDQLVNVRLVGICKPTIDRDPPIPPHLEKHVSYWDWTTNILSVPTYTGSLLNPILTRTRDKKNEELFMSLIESILLELALKAYVYYHGHCLQSEVIVSKPMSPVEPSPRKMHSVVKKDKVQFFSKLPLKESDINIVEYFTHVISEQQLSELTREGSYRPQKVVLKGHNCSTRVCKPKRLT
ncbi:PREDICTED: Smith-Magenis syndrome chromosomal region candidate gene 8 protein-like [Amphimedon queenslandica]|uniref:UDENN FLCN/SMCR8-type domain-containing protein n=1 Tax=Amphimedon queenslandica TaxID=400682 RepID=A0A1X7V0A6_AMPQE|nr:PREDICTED: Smith-Magenis syndrome chromosomal region candidate gene 8 protein-like [Amphimedon queenslandica]|eukprot:XP_011403650.1 PREDICTED: Smith-Magenis syndrome chromosomal region candidate gene 8 protein-like [Amphimedon queenslandica]